MEEQKPSPKFDAEKTAELLTQLYKLRTEMNSLTLSNKRWRRNWINKYISNLN